MIREMEATRMVVPQCVQDVLSRFESRGDFDEWELSRHIDKAIRGASVNGGELQAALAEHDAFSFRRRREGESTPHDTTFVNDLLPPERAIDVRVLGYWRERMQA